PRPTEIAASVLAALDRPGPAGPARPPGDWDRAFAAAMASIGAGPEHHPGTAAGNPVAVGDVAAADPAAAGNRP
ncbi:MAG: hypothetical protein ACR2MP_29745, partial [Streptosporangiaceae bacterium]